MTSEAQRSEASASTDELGGGRTYTASRDTWWIAMLALERHDSDGPVSVGDWCVEVSHLVGLRGQSVALDCAVGKVLSIEPNCCYLIELRDGTQHRWENAWMRRLPQPNDLMSRPATKD